ncbi:MAG: sugar ABC transporter permease [Chloroflexia bacterium]|nr:sugar ABC transporter permease [Chloroflexia bacterium]
MAAVTGEPLIRKKTRIGNRAPGHASRMRFVAISLIPILSLLVVFSLLPIGIAGWLSFHRYNQLAPTAPWIGLRNYEFAFQTDPFFRNALENTLKYALVAVPVNIVLSLPIALGLNQIKRFRAVFRTAFFMPAVASAVAVSLLWTTIYDPQAGWLNAFMNQVGLSSQPWLRDPDLAIWSVLAAAVWQDLGYNILIFLAGLQGIPDDFYDAAKVDGAGPWQRFRGITLPLLQRTTVFVLVLTMISYLQQFTHIQVMTGGGPIRSSETLVLYIYGKGFQDLQMGYAAAMSIVLMGIILLITLVQLRLLRSRWEY